MDAQVLTNGTVWLSIPTSEDIDAITECCQHPSIGEWVTIPVPYTRENAKTFIEDIVGPGWAGKSPTWAVRERADGPVVGMIGLGERDESSAEIGYWLAPRVRSRGLMSQSVALVCDYGFRPDRLALQRISWRAFVGNYPSAAVVRRTGFRYEGLSRLGSLQRGRRRDHWLAARLNTDPAGPVADWPAEFHRTLEPSPHPH
ncbi:putative acetyltransferase [Nocardia brasiliensis NBRC 14402]|uniref:GNAT family N-acetyltransferase n=1 Tax=Nocardia brasiliensis TaxID=37326 RepID=UPI00045C8994|nr:GNAT family N-acetyltransferase [Nocardia brasiliensis]ASF10246.2 N-acetyltransferase [Nocardia brasiliensis]GAJ79407.1 putative acetyltransferase [Nocardia brasiliensis NBRC 14402]SUB11292.1 Putative ribosomal N-acetyltransferase YdaF [Nocardia brasiliensis]